MFWQSPAGHGVKLVGYALDKTRSAARGFAANAERLQMSNQFTLAARLTDYRDWMIARMTEGGMIDFSQAERERIFGEWCGYNLFVRLLDAMIDQGYRLPLENGKGL